MPKQLENYVGPGDHPNSDRNGGNVIRLKGVRVHNLKSIDLEIPHGQWLTLCGRSGCGKTSLAFDTLFAEGQRRYAQSFSPYLRQFLNLSGKPDSDLIEGILPAVGLRGGEIRIHEQMTVGTITESSDYLRVVFTLIADAECPDCLITVSRWSNEKVAEFLAEQSAGSRVQLGFEVRTDEHLGQSLADLASTYQAAGFVRGIYGGKTMQLSELQRAESVPSIKSFTVIVDRLVTGKSTDSRLLESLDTCFRAGSGKIVLFLETPSAFGQSEIIDGASYSRLVLSHERVCSICCRTLVTLTPDHLDFRHALGQCAMCRGSGIAPKGTADDDVSTLCNECCGTRLNSDASSFRVAGLNYAACCQLTIAELLAWMDQLRQSAHTPYVVDLFDRLQYRLDVACHLGLDYLTLSRSAETLSHGEMRRLSLVSILGTNLVNLLYVLDEPSIGLHPCDVNRLLEVIQRLKRRGNTLILVEHEPDLVMASDRVVEIGPGQGAESGHIIFDGPPISMLDAEHSLTGRYLSGKAAWYGGTEVDVRTRTAQGHIQVRHASRNNLQSINLDIPLGLLCAVTGVSGAGKSSLVRDTVYMSLASGVGGAEANSRSGGVNIVGNQIKQVIMVDQSLPAKNSRGNLATYTDAFSDIRALFCQTPDAKVANLRASHFSFNVDGGRCEHCKGVGYLTVDMQFLPEIKVHCEHCMGSRFKSEILRVKYRQHSIAEVLDMTAREAFAFFRGQPKIQAKLKFLSDVGLDYLTLGRTLSTLSTGERQRLKLSNFLSGTARGKCLVIMDEPTIGLHMADVTKLLDCFSALLAIGHSLLVIDHNLQLLQHADYLIDLGPGAGPKGGQVVAIGTPAQVMSHADSITGEILRKFLQHVK
ncbi:MAG TPA: excinuclease ABC subunit UvrA [Pirellulaceae bacterium]|nr:excinuclease ABC subunit UvrA [Pirellulaceae bacterium]HMO92780.1 excinuclease ABC subunit UvrA [Pirellulaceae bacterium]HMP69362.1 excinuclease ABC subunit UvrA [Pirellulaceae bacterium]